MTNDQGDIVINKIYNENPPKMPPKNIPNIPAKYLELIENPDKIKQELLNTEFIDNVSDFNNQQDYFPISTKLEDLISKKYNNENIDLQSNDDYEDGNIIEGGEDDISLSSEEDYDEDDENDEEESVKNLNSPKNKYNQNLINRSYKSEQKYNLESKRGYKNNFNEKSNDYSRSNERSNERSNDYSRSNERSERSNKSEQKAIFESQSRLNKYPRSNENKYPRPNENKYDHKYDHKYGHKYDNNNRYENENYHQQSSYKNSDKLQNEFGENSIKDMYKSTNNFPKLSEIHKDYAYPNLDQMNTDINDDDLKRELLFKFTVLQQNNSTLDIPKFSMHDNYKHMKRVYDHYVKTIQVKQDVNGQYKMYLIAVFFCIEYVLGTKAGLDMKGFTESQIQSMNNYERFLIEIGEKSYTDEDSQWSVEIRLAFAIFQGTIMFIAGKAFSKKTGTNLMNFINSFNVQANPNINNLNLNQPKRKMKGPSNIDLNNIPEI